MSKKITFQNAIDGLYIHGVCDIPPVVFDVTSYTIGLCRIDETENGITVYVRRPGMLYGKGGQDINALRDYCGFDIDVVEFNPFA